MSAVSQVPVSGKVKPSRPARVQPHHEPLHKAGGWQGRAGHGAAAARGDGGVRPWPSVEHHFQQAAGWQTGGQRWDKQRVELGLECP